MGRDAKWILMGVREMQDESIERDDKAMTMTRVKAMGSLAGRREL